MRPPRDGPGAEPSPGERPTAAPGAITALLEELARTPVPPGADDLLAIHRAGDTVGRFEIVRELGRGGFGIVYEARDKELGRRVALKAIRPGDAPVAELRKQSLRHEAEAAAQLSHPNIVTLHDLTSCDGVPHLILELLDGETLEERLARGPLAPAEAVAIAREAAKALAYAHAKGVVHRDLKPSNVFLTDDGRVKVLDFGLAYVFGGRVPLRGGTVAFMAPEVRGDRPVDARADVFALGIVLWQALTGELPAPGAPRPAVDSLPGPPRLRALVARMLADDAAERPRDGAALLADLDPIERELAQPAPAAAPPPPRRGRRRRRVAAGAVALCAIALAAAVATRALARRTAEHAAGAPARAGAVAVLPFVDLSPGHDQAYFAEGLSEEVLNALTHVPGLRVVGRSSSFASEVRGGDLRAVGERLGAASVLEGSVRTAAGRVRITAQLVATADGVHLWSQTFERHVGDVFAVQDEIARAVVAALDVALRPGDAPSTAQYRTANPEAHRLYLLGRSLYNRLGEKENDERALKAFQGALALDPGYAPAWAGVALAEFTMGNQRRTEANERSGCRRALDAVERAVALGPGLAEAYSARALFRMFCSWDWPGARADLDRARALQPRDAEVLRRAAILDLLTGDLAASREGLAGAVTVDPLVPLTWRWAGLAELSAGRTAAAREAFARALEVAPGDDATLYFEAYSWILDGEPGRALQLAGRREDHGDTGWLTVIAMASHDLGREEDARRALAAVEAAANADDPDASAAWLLARYHAWTGDRDRAAGLLERCVAHHDDDAASALTDPFVSRLRGHPRYEAVLRRLGLAPAGSR